MVIIMKEIILSAGITAILGIFAFLFSQIYFKSIVRFKELKARTVHALVYYENVYHNPIDLAKMPDRKLPEGYEKASDELRKLAADWIALIELRTKPRFFIPRNSKLREVSSNLIRLCNGMTYPYNSINSIDYYRIENNIKSVTNIKRLLKIYNKS